MTLFGHLFARLFSTLKSISLVSLHGSLSSDSRGYSYNEYLESKELLLIIKFLGHGSSGNFSVKTDLFKKFKRRCLCSSYCDFAKENVRLRFYTIGFYEFKSAISNNYCSLKIFMHWLGRSVLTSLAIRLSSSIGSRKSSLI